MTDGQVDVDHLRSRVAELEEQVLRLDLLSEAFLIVHRVLDDLVEAADVDRSEYEEDLERLNQLGHLLL